MKRIIVIGCPGSGKSTLSRKLHKITGIPLFHLDMMYWNADRTIVDKVVSGAGGKFKPLDSVLNTLSRGFCNLLFPYLNSL